MIVIIEYGRFLVQLVRFRWVVPINCYLVREDDGLTLIDTGRPGSAPSIIDAAQMLNAPVRRIVLTHAHHDHAGSLDALHALLPGAEVLVSLRTASCLSGDMRLARDEPKAPLRGRWQHSATQPNRLLAAGDRVGSLEVSAAPGHTPGHIALLDTRDGTLIAGDAFRTMGSTNIARTAHQFLAIPRLGTWHRPTAIETAYGLLALTPTRLAVGHGTVLRDPVAAMRWAIVVAERQSRAGAPLFAGRWTQV